MENSNDGLSTYRPRTGRIEKSLEPKSNSKPSVQISEKKEHPQEEKEILQKNSSPKKYSKERQSEDISFEKRKTSVKGSRSNSLFSSEKNRPARGRQDAREKQYEDNAFESRRTSTRNTKAAASPRFPKSENKPTRKKRYLKDSRFEDKPNHGSYKARPYKKNYEKRTTFSNTSFDKLRKRKCSEIKDPNAPVRLNKFIANSGICSRREADEYIKNGEITVNGVVVTELGTRVKPTDSIKYNGNPLSGEKKVYLLLNKPKGYVTTLDDPHAKRTVMELIKGACSERIYPVGRLDKNTTGVLLFTNDGELTKRLTHPGFNKRKIYHVHLDKNISKEDLEQLVKGIELEDGTAYVDEISYVDEKEDKKQVGLEIHSGRNRVVRRMFEALGYEVKRLDRVYFAGLTKKSLERGKWRILAPKEINMLKMGAYE
ncbi:MAG: rRNA pseudouridine synthase [Prevotellaceae bacterium]|jgi:23S rRNA pseudouridine2605 synthase|nr:rRNA pseudouridine synthase [Prevotellaceae bacterium]